MKINKEEVFAHTCAILITSIAAPFIFKGVSSILPKEKKHVTFSSKEEEEDEYEGFGY